MRGPGSKPSLLFQLVIPATGVFVITILSMIAIVFSDPRAPVAQWLDANGNSLLIIEFVVVIILSIMAMVADRIQTLNQIRQSELNSPKNASTTDEPSVAE
jgi:hypothetical protein